MASDVYELLRQLNVPSVHIGGASMGGMVSLQFALDHPDMVRSLILVDSYPHTPAASREALDHWIADTERRDIPG